MPDDGDFHGYRAATSGWRLNDVEDVAEAGGGGGGSSLTGWETDEDGNLVCTGGEALLLANGSAEAPALAFNDHLTSGMYYDGAVCFAENGNLTFQTFWDASLSKGWLSTDILSANTRVEAIGGSEASPSLVIGRSGNDELTGLWSPVGFGGSRLIFSVLGDEKWRMTTDGKWSPSLANEVPATPDAQDVVDVLVALGILTQATP